PLASVIGRLSRRCPVFEGGAFRDRVEKEAAGQIPTRHRSHLSSTTALAWFRLEEEGFVQLQMEADAHDQLILPDRRGAGRPTSVVKWLDGGQTGADRKKSRQRRPRSDG